MGFRSFSVALSMTLLLHVIVIASMLLPRGDARSQSHVVNSPLVFAGLLPLAEPNGRVRWVTPALGSWASPAKVSIAAILPERVEIERETTVPVESAPEFVRRISAITARIQNAWSMPSVRLTQDFHCRVRLRENEGGVLSEIEVQQCDAEPALRESLSAAIRRAAPMPPLQGEAKSSYEVTLDFSAFAGLTTGRRSSVEPSTSMR